MEEDLGASQDLVREVDQYWAKAGRPVRLTDLGKAPGAARAKALCGSLSKYVETYLNDRLAIIKHSSIPLVGVVPLNKVGDVGDIDAALVGATANPSLQGDRMPRPWLGS